MPALAVIVSQCYRLAMHNCWKELAFLTRKDVNCHKKVRSPDSRGPQRTSDFVSSAQRGLLRIR
jgi:hypothetical protein